MVVGYGEGKGLLIASSTFYGLLRRILNLFRFDDLGSRGSEY
jgi:hypothetical protein